MAQEAIAGVIGFGIFFAMWVVVPAVIQKRHAGKEEDTE